MRVKCKSVHGNIKSTYFRFIASNTCIYEGIVNDDASILYTFLTSMFCINDQWSMMRDINPTRWGSRKASRDKTIWSLVALFHFDILYGKNSNDSADLLCAMRLICKIELKCLYRANPADTRIDDIASNREKNYILKSFDSWLDATAENGKSRLKFMVARAHTHTQSTEMNVNALRCGRVYFHKIERSDHAYL